MLKMLLLLFCCCCCFCVAEKGVCCKKRMKHIALAPNETFQTEETRKQKTKLEGGVGLELEGILSNETPSHKQLMRRRR